MKEVTINLTDKQLKEANEILSYYGRRLVPEENKKSQKVDVEPCEHEYEELKEEGPQTCDLESNSGGYVFLHHPVFTDAHIKSDTVHMYANETDIYFTDLEKDEIDWQEEEVQYWGNVARNLAGDLDIKITEIFHDVNPYGDTVTLNISDHLINIHYDSREEEPLDDQDDDWDDDADIKPQTFTVATDAEGRGTINKKILAAADLEDTCIGWNVFANESGTKLYITYSSYDSMIFNGEKCKRIKEFYCDGRTSIRIKFGKPYTNYNVYTKQDLITIDLSDGYQVVENEGWVPLETDIKILDYAHKKAEEYNEKKYTKEEIENTIKAVLTDVEKVKNMTGIDLSEYFIKAIEKILKPNN